MHELGLAQGILEVVLAAAKGENVNRIELSIGRGQRVVRDSLEFSFSLIAEGTSAAGARVTVTELPLVLRCRRCGGEAESEDPPWNCRRCGSPDAQIVSGDELLVDAVELEGGRVIRRPRPGGP